jgi:hypothetical protein
MQARVGIFNTLLGQTDAYVCVAIELEPWREVVLARTLPLHRPPPACGSARPHCTTVIAMGDQQAAVWNQGNAVLPKASRNPDVATETPRVNL